VAACAAPLAVAPRRTFLSRATVNGAAKKGYSSEIFSPMVYFLRLFQVWVIFV
jgi:hypothetical protein